MRLITRFTDALVNRLAPKTDADAACIFLYRSCGFCNSDHTAWCCNQYDNCPTSGCKWDRC